MHCIKLCRWQHLSPQTVGYAFKSVPANILNLRSTSNSSYFLKILSFIINELNLLVNPIYNTDTCAPDHYHGIDKGSGCEPCDCNAYGVAYKYKSTLNEDRTRERELDQNIVYDLELKCKMVYFLSLWIYSCHTLYDPPRTSARLPLYRQ